MNKISQQIRRDSRQFSAVCQALLQQGNAVRFRAQGQSMLPNIASGDVLVVAPREGSEILRGGGGAE